MPSACVPSLSTFQRPVGGRQLYSKLLGPTAVLLHVMLLDVPAHLLNMTSFLSGCSHPSIIPSSSAAHFKARHKGELSGHMTMLVMGKELEASADGEVAQGVAAVRWRCLPLHWSGMPPQGHLLGSQSSQQDERSRHSTRLQGWLAGGLPPQQRSQEPLPPCVLPAAHDLIGKDSSVLR